ncbi:MAG: hypothetical protein QOF58_8370 [Pseudonocardiales bacterium]|nr:hypothetical protein [Pseudonocardiales bacterium]
MTASGPVAWGRMQSVGPVLGSRPVSTVEILLICLFCAWVTRVVLTARMPRKPSACSTTMVA